MWLAAALLCAPFAARLQAAAEDENEAFVARSAESTEAGDLIDERFALGSEVTAVVAYTRRDGPLTEADQQRIAADARALCDSGAIPDLEAVVTPSGPACGELEASLAPETPPSRVSGDGDTALMTVDTGDEATPAVVAAVAALRERLPDPGGGLRAYVTGEAGFTADASEAFEGIDETLLAISVALVLAILLATYRSPVVAVIPVAAVVLAYLVAGAAAYALVAAGALTVTGQATSILVVLMFGAGTDYALLLVARRREEGALAPALARTAPTVLSAGATVAVAMLALALADYRATRAMGPVLALGVAVMVAAALTLVPALLAIAGRRGAAAPRRPRAVWERVAGLVRRRPAATAAAALAVLAAGALGTLPDRGALDFTEGFRDPPESVRGLELVKAEFGPGRAAPAQLVVAVDRSPDVIAALDEAPGVAAATPVSYSRDGRLMLVDLELAGDPFAEAARRAVPRLREIARRAAGGGTALIGGPTAETHDARAAQRRDAAMVAPLALVLVLLVVAALVRAVVAPLYLVATVVLSYAFALGAGSLVFTHLLGEPDSDPGLPLFAFIFLVALGADYNLFLVSRILEERRRLGPADAVAAGLTRTGGVITSAGLILAATFASLMALPIVGLIQIGFTVALGVLVDTFLVRVLLVPAIAVLLGDRSWWPRRPFADNWRKVLDQPAERDSFGLVSGGTFADAWRGEEKRP